jgi:hypothetical protein
VIILAAVYYYKGEHYYAYMNGNYNLDMAPRIYPGYTVSNPYLTTFERGGDAIDYMDGGNSDDIGEKLAYQNFLRNEAIQKYYNS